MSFLDSWLFSKQRSRKGRIYDVSFEVVAGLLQLDGTFALKMDGFPQGARLSFIEADNERGILRLYVEHESFEETFEGCALPTASAICVTRIAVPDAVKVEVTS